MYFFVLCYVGGYIFFLAPPYGNADSLSASKDVSVGSMAQHMSILPASNKEVVWDLASPSASANLTASHDLEHRGREAHVLLPQNANVQSLTLDDLRAVSNGFAHLVSDTLLETVKRREPTAHNAKCRQQKGFSIHRLWHRRRGRKHVLEHCPHVELLQRWPDVSPSCSWKLPSEFMPTLSRYSLPSVQLGSMIRSSFAVQRVDIVVSGREYKFRVLLKDRKNEGDPLVFVDIVLLCLDNPLIEGVRDVASKRMMFSGLFEESIQQLNTQADTGGINLWELWVFALRDDLESGERRETSVEFGMPASDSVLEDVYTRWQDNTLQTSATERRFVTVAAPLWTLGSLLAIEHRAVVTPKTWDAKLTTDARVILHVTRDSPQALPVALNDFRRTKRKPTTFCCYECNASFSVFQDVMNAIYMVSGKRLTLPYKPRHRRVRSLIKHVFSSRCRSANPLRIKLLKDLHVFARATRPWTEAYITNKDGMIVEWSALTSKKVVLVSVVFSGNDKFFDRARLEITSRLGPLYIHVTLPANVRAPMLLWKNRAVLVSDVLVFVRDPSSHAIQALYLLGNDDLVVQVR